jgi:hypothetical protein
MCAGDLKKLKMRLHSRFLQLCRLGKTQVMVAKDCPKLFRIDVTFEMRTSEYG